MSTWLLPYADLTPDQRRIVEAPPDQHRLVMGFPGSGKTQVLVHRADYLRKRLGSPPGRFRVMIFTNVLRDYIRSGLDLLGLPLNSVCTFDSWCNAYYKSHIGPRRRGSGGDEGTSFEMTHAAVLQRLRGDRSEWGHLDFALVDEGQDLRPECFEILRLAAKHITVFADPQQQIYEEGASLERIRENLGLARSQTALLAAFRNSPDVAALAAFFIQDDERRSQYVSQSRFRVCERERPLYYSAASEDAEYDRLAEAVRGRQVLNQRVGILVARNQLVFRVASALRQRGLHVERAVPQFKGAYKSQIEARFDNNVPKIATFHSAKGLTFDAVCMPRLNETSFVRFKGAQRRRILFVGIARAIQWVFLSSVKGEPFEEQTLFEAAARTGKLVIQQAGTKASHTAAPCQDDYSVL
ncbi:MAG: UvrD-helicase domain-containing protein [Acidobacteriota bacterium]